MNRGIGIWLFQDIRPFVTFNSANKIEKEEPVVGSIWGIPLSSEKINDPFRKSSEGIMMKILRTQKGNNGDWYVEYCYKGSNETWLTEYPHSKSFEVFKRCSKRV